MVLAGWPADMRIVVRRDKIEHGTQVSLFEQINGYRYQVIATAPAPIQCECRRLVCLGCRAFALRVRRVRDVRFLAMAPSS